MIHFTSKRGQSVFGFTFPRALLEVFRFATSVLVMVAGHSRCFLLPYLMLKCPTAASGKQAWPSRVGRHQGNYQAPESPNWGSCCKQDGETCWILWISTRGLQSGVWGVDRVSHPVCTCIHFSFFSSFFSTYALQHLHLEMLIWAFRLIQPGWARSNSHLPCSLSG